MKERGGSDLSGSQAEVTESFGEAIGADMSLGLAAGDSHREVPWSPRRA